jgi:hypothetical protein
MILTSLRDHGCKSAQGSTGKQMEKKKMAKNVYSKPFNTNIGRVSYPHVYEKGKPMEEGGEGKFELTLLIPKKEDISALRKTIDEVGKEFFGKAWEAVAKKKPAIRDGDEWANEKKAEGKDAEVYRGNWYIRPRTNDMPHVVGPDKKPISKDSKKFYGGCWARANVTAGSYDQKGGKGVGLYLNAVQKVRDDEPFGNAGVDPDAVFDAFEEAAVGAGSDDNF